MQAWIGYAEGTHSASVEWDITKGSGERQQHRTNSNRAHAPVNSDAYATLFLLPTAPRAVVKAAYRALADIHHPDHGGTTLAMQTINAAYASLTKAA